MCVCLLGCWAGVLFRLCVCGIRYRSSVRFYCLARLSFQSGAACTTPEDYSVHLANWFRFGPGSQEKRLHQTSSTVVTNEVPIEVKDMCLQLARVFALLLISSFTCE